MEKEKREVTEAILFPTIEIQSKLDIFVSRVRSMTVWCVTEHTLLRRAASTPVRHSLPQVS